MKEKNEIKSYIRYLKGRIENNGLTEEQYIRIQGKIDVMTWVLQEEAE